jgi:hypothetical protein
MNENDFSAAFDAEDTFASRMDYMRRKRRRRRRRRSRKGRRRKRRKCEGRELPNLDEFAVSSMGPRK